MARLAHGLAGDVGVVSMSTMGEQPTFAVLGSFQVERNGEAVDCGGLKQRAVLALLVVNANRPLSTERMVDELWGEDPPPTAVATLQAYISNLRRVLEPDRPARTPSTVLVSRVGTYELVVDPDAVDALRFERLVMDGLALLADQPETARARLVDALALWRGSALVEFESYDFAAAEISRLDALHTAATEAAIEAELILGGGPNLIPDLERLVEVHPLRERFWSQLMRAYYRAGRQADSLRAFGRCRARLVDELGIEPSPELRALEQAVLEQDRSLSPCTGGSRSSATSSAHARPAGSGPVGSWAGPATEVQRATGTEPQDTAPSDGIVGRDDELKRFRRAVDRAGRGHGSVLLIDGDPGVGKTRLLEAMRLQADTLGCHVALARCVEVGGSPPFWPWTQIVRAFGHDAIIEAAGPYGLHLASLGPDTPSQTADIPTVGLRRYQLAEGLVEAMRRLGEGGPVVVLIDDLYCADPDSLYVLSLIGAAIADAPIVVVGTNRSRGPSRNHALGETLVQLARLDWCQRERLAPLDRRHVEELVHRIGGAGVDAAAVTAIAARAEGNAFFTVELARLLLIGDRSDGGTGLIPDTIREVVARHLDGLAPDAVALLRVAALVGRTFDVAVVSEAAALDVAVALELADAAVAEGIVEEAGAAGHYRFSHLLVIEAIVTALGAFRRAQLHGRIAAVLEDRFLDDEQRWHEIAHHRFEAVPITGPGPAVEALARAGRQAVALNAMAAADQLLTRRHSLVMSERPSAARDAAELESLLDLSVIWTWRNGYQCEEMRRAADRMLQLAQAAGPEAILDPTTATGLRHGLLQAIQARCSYEIVGGNITASAVIAETMLSTAELNPHPYVTAVANINAEVAALHHGRIGDAVVHSDCVNELLPVVDPGDGGEITLPIGHQSLTVTHLDFDGWIRRMAGDPDSAGRSLQRARAVADRTGHPFTRTFHATIECVVAAVDGSPEWVMEVLDWEGRYARPDRFGFLDPALDLYRHWAVGVRSDPLAAAGAVREAIAELDRQGASVVRTLHWALVAELELLGGRPADSLQSAQAGLDHADRTDERFWAPELLRLLAAAYGALGRDSDQLDALTRADEEAARLGMTCFRRRVLARSCPDLPRRDPHRPDFLAECRPATSQQGEAVW